MCYTTTRHLHTRVYIHNSAPPAAYPPRARSRSRERYPAPAYPTPQGRYPPQPYYDPRGYYPAPGPGGYAYPPPGAYDRRR